MLSGKEILKLSRTQIRGNRILFYLYSFMLMVINPMILLLQHPKINVFLLLSIIIIEFYFYAVVISCALKAGNNQKLKFKDIGINFKIYLKIIGFGIIMGLIMLFVGIIMLIITSFMISILLVVNSVDEFSLVAMLLVIFVITIFIGFTIATRYVFSPYIIVTNFESLGIVKSMKISRYLSKELKGKIVKMFLGICIVSTIFFIICAVILYKVRSIYLFYGLIVAYLTLITPEVVTYFSNVYYEKLLYNIDEIRERLEIDASKEIYIRKINVDEIFGNENQNENYKEGHNENHNVETTDKIDDVKSDES
ncbi:hypothetical protein [Peptostreptococcus sp. D1]|uniref:hypothetical protein n=1 Tax=Peptostreptococcus sp. D1 TaxID=72304 RepID=UPI0008E38C65|nr:hypothetical protein [Peptostreptococcus sp. D1]SFE27254.1 hypothetical protein SAMN02910278_00489 [Peptostreptococcus sp. D1]